MKKYMYLGVILGAIALAGCSVNKESEEQVQVKEELVEDATNRQAVEVETLPDADKEEAVPVTPLELTQELKEDYHKQYVEIVKEINAEEGTNHLEVVPIDEFKPKDWVVPEKFRQLAIERATMEFTSKVFGGDPVQ
ncbi:hypothetical protein D4T97_006475 [Siminovitchia acidinfaciens]|uniref:Uncharacterized protein n=1 Tax=Siminovitchia acidinfaciens TaxID=2321395 RepID=A0A429Y4U6_9BACI|nr:hypothetical protein [Siminovitchia acidinfaciens]RST76408.1 hypothetical protein D4T97_006475 [Siminovitchia acidinfaciens]